ncbi:MAG: PhnD/SsuA/transferrin family substrate-binding protein [Burkholderiaceae bacterium]
MRVFLRFFFGGWLVLALVGVALPVRAAPAAPVRLGILATLGLGDTRAAFAATVLRLKASLGDRPLELSYYDLPGLERAVLDKRLDFFIANSGFYAAVEPAAHARHLATLKIPQADDPNRSMASAFVVRADRADLRDVPDLAGRSVMAVAPTAFGGYQIALGELKRRGHDPESYFGRLGFSSYPMQNVLDEVLAGRVDAGIVRACLVEEMEQAGTLPAGAIRVVGERHDDGFRCRHSTALYPDWTFASLPAAGSALSKQVTAALLTMAPTADGQEWSIASDFGLVDALFRELQLGPYLYLREWTLAGLAQRHWPWLMLLALLVLGGLAHLVLASALVRARTADLRRALSERDRMEAAARASRDRIDALERAGVVGQMSSMFAHELKQPLAAISNFSRGLKRRLDRGAVDADVVAQVMDEVAAQSSRAADIVDRVRAYARRRAPQRERVDLARVAAAAADLFERSGRSSTPVERRLDGPAWAEADALEIELLILNLLKNAADATAGTARPLIELRLIRHGPRWWLGVADNGPALDDEQMAGLFTPLNSKKPDGLGLGLAIAARIAEAHGGRLDVARRAPHGLQVGLDLPLLENCHAM